MLYTEHSVRDNIRNREGKRVFILGKEDRLTPGARDWLNRERIEILDPGQARPEEYRLLGGGVIREKPEHMTHLNGDTMVPKTHPRILFRGKMDTLEAEIVLCQLKVPQFSKELGQILEFIRVLLRCDVLDAPVEGQRLCGMTEQEIRLHSHRPQEFYDQPHFMPSASDGEGLLWLNRARCAAREAELSAVAAFTDREGAPTREDLLRGMNRVSSMLYILMIRKKKEECDG